MPRFVCFGVLSLAAASELNALRVAFLLHDIGRLAVPERIIAPGKLTAEEFEKAKIHPLVGAQILEPVQFRLRWSRSFAVHHEKFDGGGYPSGAKGKEIPTGARILAAATPWMHCRPDGQYRRALPLEKQ